jgi:hypothetical protein
MGVFFWRSSGRGTLQSPFIAAEGSSLCSPLLSVRLHSLGIVSNLRVWRRGFEPAQHVAIAIDQISGSQQSLSEGGTQKINGLD